MNEKKERIGLRNVNTQGVGMQIVEYNTRRDMTVLFDTGEVRNHVRWDLFNTGQVPVCTIKNKQVMCKADAITHNKLARRYYHSMWNRCTNSDEWPSYIGCYVCQEWNDFHNFLQWFENNYYQIPNERMELDKDILVKGNKEYRPDRCVFVPSCINIAVRTNSNCKSDLPVGVRSLGKRYAAFITKYGKKLRIGVFDTQEEAYFCYKMAKESYIRELADKYKDQIPDILYNALYNYKIEN